MPETIEIDAKNSPQIDAPPADLPGKHGSQEPEEVLVELGEVIATPQPPRVRNPRVKHPPIIPTPDTDPVWVPVKEPTFRAYYNDHENKMQRTKAGYGYWCGLTEAQKGRIDAYIYRDWPILKAIPEDSKEYGYIDKILGVEPIRDDNDILDRYGSGDYHIFLNQTLPAEVAKQLKDTVKRTLCTFYIRGLRDLKSRPPCDKRVSDVEQVDLTDPANKTYVEYLRMRGSHPDQQNKERLEDEMASIQTIEKLTDKIITMADESGKRGQQPIMMQPQPTPESTQVIIDATNKAMDIVQSAAVKANEDRKDPLDTAIRLVELINRKPDASAVVVDSSRDEEIRDMRKQIADMQAAQLQSMQEQLREMSARLASPAIITPPTTQFSSIKEGITAFKEMKNLVDSVSGGGGGEGEGGGLGGPGWLKSAAAMAPHVSSVLQSAQNIFAMWQMGQMRGQQPQPQPQPPSPMQQHAAAQPQPSAPTTLGPQLVPPNPQPILPNPLGPPNYGLPEQAANIFSQIRIALLNHLEAYAAGDEDMNGKNFADWFLYGFGEEAFKSATVGGDELLVQAIYSYPPIAEWLPKTGIDDAKFRQFVKEFVSYKPEEEGEGETGETGEGEETPVPAPVA